MSPNRILFSVALGLLSALLSGPSMAQQSESAGGGLQGVRISDIDGGIHRLGVSDGVRPIALVLLDTSCPVSARYVPTLGKLDELAMEAGVEFYGVLSDPSVSLQDALAYRSEYGIEFPILFDATGTLTDRLHPTHVPEAFVIGSDDRMLYRGRIDDRFVALGKLRQGIGSHDLRDAIEGAGEASLLAGELVRTPVIGCVFEAWDGGLDQLKLTYTRDVAPILHANCVTCHRSGDIGPFGLENYAQAKKRARMLALVTSERTMPPWHAVPGFGSFRDERVLSQREIDVLSGWAKAGAPEGDAADLLPAPRRPKSSWRLGEPDLVVELPQEFVVPAEGEDIYQYFVIPSKLIEDEVLVGIDFRPGDPSVVHHLIVYLDESGQARELDKRTDEPGFSLFGGEDSEGYDKETGFTPESLRTVAGWAPGTDPYKLPDGMGIPLQAGGDFVFEVHYHLNGKETRDQSSMALYFAKQPVEFIVESLVIGTESVDIPAGVEDYRREVYMDLPSDLRVLDVSPHMHYLGKDVKAEALLPNGDVIPMLHVDDWDFRWQSIYFYREPLSLPKGTRIKASFTYDNSAKNPFNPSSPPIRVKEGWRTVDEMCLFSFSVVPEKESSKNALYMAMFMSFMRSADAE